MKNKEFKELKSKKKDELFKLINAKKLEADKITARIQAGREKNLKKAKILKREIAQILTVLNEKGVKE